MPRISNRSAVALSCAHCTLYADSVRRSQSLSSLAPRSHSRSERAMSRLSTHSTPRVGKSVHYEDTPPPIPHFPLPYPYNQRMIGFGCPDVTVPKQYIGPRKGVWQAPAPGITPQQLDQALQAGLDESDAGDAAAIARIDCYDLSHQPVGPGSNGAMHRAAMIWKSPARRKALKTLLLSHAQLDDSCVRTLAKLVAQAPTALAPLALSRLVLDDNDAWGGAVGKLFEAFANNPHASVQRLEANNCHVGAIAGAEGNKKDAAADATDAAVAASPPASDDAPVTPRTLAAQAAAAAMTAAAARAATAFAPLIPFLSKPHCHLQVLSLAQCSITDVLVAYLAEGLRGNQTLIELYLGDNSISDTGAKMIAQALGGKRTEEAAAEAAAIAAAAAAAQAATEAAAAAAAAALAEDPSKAAASARSTSRNGTRAAPVSKPAAPSHAKTGSSLSGGNKTPLSSDKKNLSFGIGSSGRDSHRDGSNSADGEAEGSTDHPADALTFILPTFPAQSSTNSTLRVLDLSANRVGVVGLQHLLSMARLHLALRRCAVQGQRGVASFDQAAVESLGLEIESVLHSNASRSLRETKLAFAIGLHPRAGAHAGMKALVDGARVLADSLEGGGPQGSGFSSEQSSRTQSRQSHIPSLPLHDDDPARFGSSNGGLRSSAPASPTSALIRNALDQVWEYVGMDL